MNNINFNDLSNKPERKMPHINIGYMIDIHIKDCTYLIRYIIDLKEGFAFDHPKHDGTMKKLDAHDWKARISLSDSDTNLYKWYIQW
jgi:hypothetical protein